MLISLISLRGAHRDTKWMIQLGPCAVRIQKMLEEECCGKEGYKELAYSGSGLVNPDNVAVQLLVPMLVNGRKKEKFAK